MIWELARLRLELAGLRTDANNDTMPDPFKGGKGRASVFRARNGEITERP